MLSVNAVSRYAVLLQVSGTGELLVDGCFPSRLLAGSMTVARHLSDPCEEPSCPITIT